MMDWLKNYQLFLLDFDGLLVNTEELHYFAYKEMCKRNGVELTWDFSTYCSMAHISSRAIRDALYKQFPSLKQHSWEKLYADKKNCLMETLHEGKVSLMPGVEEFLLKLQSVNAKRCVVTHSPMEIISLIRKQHPILQTIPHWITREDYNQPKPEPDCYLKAIDLLASPRDKMIGFEDTPRGITALLHTPVKAVMISSFHYPEIPTLLNKGVTLYSSFNEFMSVKC